jgi:threonine/homoserine/homoserine lactone efflux protein
MVYLFFQGILLGLLVSISLGPAFFAIIQTGITRGFRNGIFMAAGISLSDVMLVTISYLIGASLFDDANNKVYVGLVGGIILIIFGSVSWAKKPDIMHMRHLNMDEVNLRTRGPLSYVLKGFFMNIANPFLFFFWFGALGFVGKNSDQGHILESTVVFFSGSFITIFLADVLKSFVGGKIKRYLSPRREIFINKSVGLALVAFGIILIFRTLIDYGFFEYLQNIRLIKSA